MMGSSELLVKITGTDRAAVEGLARFLRENLEHAYPGPVRPNDRDQGVHCFVNITIEGSEAAKIRRVPP